MSEPQNPQPAQAPKAFFDALTGIRGVSCVFVILTHELGTFRKGNPSLTNAGVLSVLIFFILSAYLLTKNILKEIQPDKDKAPKTIPEVIMIMVRYCVRRLFRVYPAFIVVVLINHIFYEAYKSRNLFVGVWFKEVWRYYKLGIVANHLWTIRIEMAFYFIMLPAFAAIASISMIIDYKYLKNSRFKTFYLVLFLLASLIIIIQVIRFTVFFHKDVNLYDYLSKLWPHIPFFGYGMLAGVASYYLRNYKLVLNTKLKKAICEASLYAILLFLYFANPAIAEKYLFRKKRPDISWWQTNAFLGPFIALSFLILEKAGTQCTIGQFLSNGLIVLMGTCSYSVYLIHYAMLIWISYLIKDNSQFDGTFLVVLGAFLAGFIIYKCVEEPCYKLNKYAIKYIEKFINWVVTWKDRRRIQAQKVPTDEPQPNQGGEGSEPISPLKQFNTPNDDEGSQLNPALPSSKASQAEIEENTNSETKKEVVIEMNNDPIQISN